MFNDLGRSVLDNAWKGFNASLFAYGQTGSGKSYSVFGYGVNKVSGPIRDQYLGHVIRLDQSGAYAQIT